MCEGSVLLNVHRKIQKVFIFAAHCFTTQAPSLVCECPLEYVMDPRWLGGLTFCLLLVCAGGGKEERVMQPAGGLVRAHPPTCQQVSYCVEEVVEKLVSILLL